LRGSSGETADPVIAVRYCLPDNRDEHRRGDFEFLSVLVAD
jgi:hypothetical protein